MKHNWIDADSEGYQLSECPLLCDVPVIDHEDEYYDEFIWHDNTEPESRHHRGMRTRIPSASEIVSSVEVITGISNRPFISTRELQKELSHE